MSFITSRFHDIYCDCSDCYAPPSRIPKQSIYPTTPRPLPTGDELADHMHREADIYTGTGMIVPSHEDAELMRKTWVAEKTEVRDRYQLYQSYRYLTIEERIYAQPVDSRRGMPGSWPQADRITRSDK